MSNGENTEGTAKAQEQGKMIYSNRMYGLSGATILTVLDMLKDNIPTRFAGVVVKVEDLLSQSEELQPEGPAEYPTIAE